MVRRWSYTGEYFARIRDEAISIYETPVRNFRNFCMFAFIFFLYNKIDGLRTVRCTFSLVKQVMFFFQSFGLLDKKSVKVPSIR